MLTSIAFRWVLQFLFQHLPQSTKDIFWDSVGFIQFGRKIGDSWAFRTYGSKNKVRRDSLINTKESKYVTTQFDTNNQAELEEVSILEEHQNSVSCLCVWGENLVSASYDHHIKIWNSQRTVIRSWEAHQGYITCLLIWNDFLVSASCDKTIKVWNRNGECLHRLEGHNHWIWWLVVWNNMLCSASLDDMIKIWDKTGREVQTLVGHTSSVYSLLAMDSDINNGSKTNAESVLWSGSADRTIRVWNSSYRCIQVVKAKTPVRCLIKWKERIYAGCENGTVQVYTPEGVLQEVVKQHTNYVWCFSIFRDQLITGSCDRNICIFKSSFKTKKHNATVLALCVWKGHLWSGSADKTIRRWKDKRHWKAIRLLWIAFYKEMDNELCLLRTLPKEILTEIILYL
mmetsp:Transcript_26320/g.37062  ORF Transcript_26320/g.37062 Transcript_26320/m.37062 type:complete len:399 (+) Transcript_26320:79-1275(+)